MIGIVSDTSIQWRLEDEQLRAIITAILMAGQLAAQAGSDDNYNRLCHPADWRVDFTGEVAQQIIERAKSS